MDSTAKAFLGVVMLDLTVGSEQQRLDAAKSYWCQIHGIAPPQSLCNYSWL